MKKRIFTKATVFILTMILMVTASTAVSAAGATVRNGSRGTDVVNLQVMLNVLDDSLLKADGIFGPATLGRVKSYQSTRGLVSDGIVGAKTWAKLDGEMSAAISKGTQGSVNVSSGYLSVRDTPRSTGLVLTSFSNGTAVTVIGKSGDWLKISSGSVYGFVLESYINTTTINTTNNAQALISTAKSYVGSPYSQSLAGTTNSQNQMYFDCSYLVKYSFEQYNVTLPRTAAGQAEYLVKAGLKISKSDLTPGDLIFWSGSSNGRYMNVYHVAIYAGNGYMIDTSASTNQVAYRKMWGTPSLYCDTSKLL